MTDLQQPFVASTTRGELPAKEAARPAFISVLFPAGDAALSTSVPECFRDLNLDQIVTTITEKKDVYDLKAFFYTPLHDVETVNYRQAVFRDLEEQANLAAITRFATVMQTMRDNVAQCAKLYYKEQRQRVLLQAILDYCSAVEALDAAFAQLRLNSNGLQGIRSYLSSYCSGSTFTSLGAQATKLASALEQVEYDIVIYGGGFTVQRYGGETDYSAEVLDVFQKFRQNETKSHLVRFRETFEMNHIEAKVLEFVALLHPDLFRELDRFVTANETFADPLLVRFDREVQFYVSYLAFCAPMRTAGLEFSYPRVSTTDKTVRADNAFDVALANKLVPSGAKVVTNDLLLEGVERVLVVSGPNQGGKTTFARMFGQLHHLAALGCPVAGRDTQLFLPDRIFTHFEREENMQNRRGKLQDDLVRIHAILSEATSASVLIMNEIFNSTTLQDALFLAHKVFDRILALDIVCLCVTFLDELATMSPKTVSMVSMVVPDDPAQRTYRVIRQAADGRSYAISIAEKYRVTYDQLNERLAGRSATSTAVAGSAS